MTPYGGFGQAAHIGDAFSAQHFDIARFRDFRHNSVISYGRARLFITTAQLARHSERTSASFQQRQFQVVGCFIVPKKCRAITHYIIDTHVAFTSRQQ